MLAGVVTQRMLSAPAGAPPDTLVATRLDIPVSLPPFSLDGADGPFTNASLQGAWHVLFFGFTNCPDICPTTLATLADAVAVARQDIASLNVVFVSVDPQRDGPADAARYAGHFDSDFIGITGNDDALLALTKPLGILYMSVPQGDDAYTVDHSSSLLLINPAGELAAVFSAPHDATSIAADLVAIAGPGP